MIIGYARVSTGDQRLDLQIQALENIGCDRIFADHGQSGFRFSRSGLDGALKTLKPGGTLVVWRLDRLGRSLSRLVSLMEQLGERNIHFRSVTENIDTASSGGKLMFHMMAALAEFERSLISERTKAGMAAARNRGVRMGRPKSLSADQLQFARNAINCQRVAPMRVAQDLNVSIRTLHRRMAEFGPPPCKAQARENDIPFNATDRDTCPIGARQRDHHIRDERISMFCAEIESRQK
jgi:DNA invertase Pin-like site-specific DNA recombinase